MSARSCATCSRTRPLRRSSSTPPWRRCSHRCSRSCRRSGCSSRSPTSRGTASCRGRRLRRALASSSPEGPPVEPSGDDLYILYTGGTTGMRRACSGVRTTSTRRRWGAARSARGSSCTPTRRWPRPPGRSGLQGADAPSLMHGAAQWSTFINSAVAAPSSSPTMPAVSSRPTSGGRSSERGSPRDAGRRRNAPPAPRRARRPRPRHLFVARLRKRRAPLTAAMRERLHSLLPNVLITDAAGSSETGAQCSRPPRARRVSLATSRPGRHAGRRRDAAPHLEPGHPGIGWLAQAGRIPSAT